MAVYPGAIWRGNCINNSGPRGPVTRGVVEHVNDGPNVSLWSWVNRPDSHMSCHFQILQDGTIEQYLDTDLTAWCQANGNRHWISIEMPTRPNVGKTAAQIRSAAHVIAWAAQLYKFPLQLTDDPNGTGIGWHGMGGADWGNHPGCPGPIRLSQRPELLTAARGGTTTTTTTPEEDDVPYLNWPQRDRTALVNDLTKAMVDRQMGGVEFDGTFAEMQAAILGTALTVKDTLCDPKEGTHIRVAELQLALAKLPDEIEAAVRALPTNGPAVDTDALADSILAKLGLQRAVAA